MYLSHQVNVGTFKNDWVYIVESDDHHINTGATHDPLLVTGMI